ncbi:hypothetical protein AB0J83_11040 [Actinoplanes sp. NPDC049596]|uniref:hypothetical protein n=1 Tax=unclassified Actinoplanes TaxID=2626549 RepID=UPI00341EAA82
MSLNDEEEVKKALDIDSWRNLSKEKVMRFAAMMPDMSNEVRMKIIEQFPNFKELALGTLSTLKGAHESTLGSNTQNQENIHNAYQDIRNALKEELKRDDLSAEDRRIIHDKLMETGQRESEKDTENKRFLDGQLNKVLAGAGAAIAAGLVFVGAKVAIEHGIAGKDSA